jgi:putative Mg2+ transporter-C (MgtC) family protein
MTVIVDQVFWDMLFKLLLAILAGGLVGMERERRDRAAGLRTHILVCLGSTLITLVSIYIAPVGDPARIAAQIVSGIGFLGAGTIFRSGSGISGLTTAAGLWVIAGIGMGIGAGGRLLMVAMLTAILVFIVNKWVRFFEDRLVRSFCDIRLTTSRRDDGLAQVFKGLDGRGVVTERVEWLEEGDDREVAVVRLRVRVPAAVRGTDLTSFLADMPGVQRVDWE